ncbi:MAG: formate dehydrogenase accessory sulfurtransferase FdhD [Gemmatimonadales bacterium]|jgi:FdhD protein
MNDRDPRTHSVDVVKLDGPSEQRTGDLVAAEDPLEIRLGETALAVVMRTPGDDDDLVRGFLLTEGILLRPTEIARIDRIDESRVSVVLADGVEVDATRFQRNLFMSSSCGVCGKASIEAVQLFARPAPAFTVPRTVVAGLTGRLRDAQPTFDATGGLHAAGIYDLAGNALAVREDVGRHNAVDKAIGAVSVRTWPLPASLLAVSGRQSFEIVQKAAVAGIGGVIGVSAPSSLAVELAQTQGMLLAGFARGERLNVYAGAERLTA